MIALLLLASRGRAQDFQQRRPEPPDAAVHAPALTRPPRLVRPPQPVYPPEALAERLSGDVTLRIDIGAAGEVTAAQAVVRAGHGFDEAAEAAARDMLFEPAEIDGKPGAIRIEYVLHFRPTMAAADGAAPDAGAGASDGGLPDGGGDAVLVDTTPPPPRLVLAHGHIRERGTRDPIAGAEVIVTPLGPANAPAAPPEASSVTDEEGAFALTGQPGERVRFVISDGQHEPCVQEVVLPASEAAALSLTCTVTRRANDYETVVEAPKRGEEVTRHTLSQPELTTVPGTFGDPLRVIQNLPGVARVPYGLGLLVIRGASPQDSGVYIDGVKVPLLYHFAVGPSIITPDLIDRIDFYPGGFGVRYGRATAGVVDVTTRTESLSRVHGSADVDFLDSSAYLEGPVGKGWSAAIAARRSYIDVLLPLVLPSRETVAAPVYWDYQARLTRTFVGGERIAISAFGSHDSLRVINNDPDRGNINLETSVGFHRLIAAWTRPFGGWTSRLSGSYGHDAFGFDAGQVTADASANVFGLREDLNHPLGRKLALAVGLDDELRFDRVDFNIPLPVERRTYGVTERDPVHIGRDLTNLGTAAYAELLWDVAPGLRAVPGLRFDWFHYSATDKTSFDPRLVLRWTATPRTVLKGGVGIYHQPPSPAQLDAIFGNPRLPLIWADQYHLGIERAFTDAIGLDATLYYLRRHEIPLGSSRQSADGYLERYAPEGVGRGYGLELLIKHRPTRHFFGWISYTLSRSEQRRFNPTDTGFASTPYHPTDFDQTHNLVAVLSRTFDKWELGARFRLVTGVPETPVLGAFYDADYATWNPVNGAAGSIRRQTFHQLDLRAERTFTFDTWRLSLYLDVQNVYNAKNPEATLYDYRYQQSGPLRGLPFLPILGIKGRM